jgi:hypothetical protein
MSLTNADKLLIEQRRARVAALYLQGDRSVRAIARVIGVSFKTVARDLTAIRAMWKESVVRDFDQAIDTMIAYIDYRIKELQAEWVRSKAARTKTKKKTGQGSKSGVWTADEDETEIQVGEVAIMAEIRKCEEERAKLLGLYAPEKRKIDLAGALNLKTVREDMINDAKYLEYCRALTENSDAGNFRQMDQPGPMDMGQTLTGIRPGANGSGNGNGKAPNGGDATPPRQE